MRRVGVRLTAFSFFTKLLFFSTYRKSTKAVVFTRIEKLLLKLAGERHEENVALWQLQEF